MRTTISKPKSKIWEIFLPKHKISGHKFSVKNFNSGIFFIAKFTLAYVKHNGKILTAS